MHPILGEPFGFTIRSFGVMVALGFLAAYALAIHEAKRTRRVHPDVIGDLLLWVLVGGILGARLLYVIVHWEEFAPAPVRILQIWQGGLVYYGGFLGAFAAGWIFTRRRKLSFVMLGDICLPGAMLGQSIGRIGCLLVGDDYGRPAPDLPWAITFPDVPHSLMPAHLIGVPLHPTQIYMALQAFTIFVILMLVARRQRFTGQVLFLALMLYPVGRSICETFRGDDAARGMFLGVSTSQWISVPIFLAGLIGYVMASRRRGRVAASAPGR